MGLDGSVLKKLKSIRSGKRIWKEKRFQWRVFISPAFKLSWIPEPTSRVLCVQLTRYSHQFFLKKNKRKNRFFFFCVQSEKERILVSLSLQLVFNSRRYFNDERKTSIHLSLSSQHLFLFFVFDFGGQTENDADRWQFPFFYIDSWENKGGDLFKRVFINLVVRLVF